MQYEILNVKSINSPEEGNGGLSFFESGREIPFDIKRFYYIYGVAAEKNRGMHMHKELRQFIFCPYGEIELTLDNGFRRETICLDNPRKGILIEPGLWREMHWVKSNSVLCVAASEYYDENDYIRNYEDFLSYVRNKE